MPKVSPIIRSALFVKNLKTQSRFYRQALGFDQIYYQGRLDAPAAPKIVGAKAGATLDCCILRGKQPNLGMVGLFQLDPLPPTSMTHTNHIALGESVMVFYCDQLEQVMKKAVDLGATVLCEPLEFEMPHETQLEVMLRDPEGFAINLVERDPQRAFHTHSVVN